LLKDFSDLKQRPDKGILHEIFVCLHLQRQLLPNMELRFWRTKRGDEVDFVIVKNRKPIPIEVKSDIKAPQIPSGLAKFLHAYPECKQAYVFNENLNGEVKVNNAIVQFKTLNKAEQIEELQEVSDT